MSLIEPVYKKFVIEGQELNKWVKLISVKDFDPNGNFIKYTAGDQKELYFAKYDSNRNKIYEKELEGKEYKELWIEYDNKNREIHRKRSDGWETWHEYDSNGNEIHFKNIEGFERWTEYDVNGNAIHEKTSDGFNSYTEYYSDGKIRCYRDSDGKEITYEWNSSGCDIYTKFPDGREEHSEGDFEGKQLFPKIYEVHRDIRKIYDKNGNLIYQGGEYPEEFYEYEYYANGNKKTEYRYKTI